MKLVSLICLQLLVPLAGCCKANNTASEPETTQEPTVEEQAAEAPAPATAPRPRPRIPPQPEAPDGLNFIDAYTARLSEQDHTNSKGTRLSTVAMILQEDRGNFHGKKRPDAEDSSDSFFTSFEVRKGFQDYITNGRVPSNVSQAILNGTPLVQVSIFESRDHSTNAVVVQLIEP
jgi:hypothetical protein